MRVRGLPLFIIAGAMLVLWYGWVVLSSVLVDLGKNAPADYAGTPVVVPSDPVLGPADAPVTIIEYGDFQCPACADQRNQLAELYLLYPNRIRWVWKDFPDTDLHRLALEAGIAAQCAGEQGSFWEYHDFLFASQEALGNEQFTAIAKLLELDTDAFALCRTRDDIRRSILAERDQGIAIGVDGTPYLFINGERYNTLLTLTELREIVDPLITN